jgi:hypothetical protein
MRFILPAQFASQHANRDGLPPHGISEPSLRLAGGLLFARFRWWEQPILRETINALFLPSARPTFWGTPNNPRLPKKRGAVRLNLLRDVALQTIGLDASILRYRDRSKHHGGRDNNS